jgi:hypothetical protein
VLVTPAGRLNDDSAAHDMAGEFIKAAGPVDNRRFKSG